MNALEMWTIYEKPKDYPNGFVVRRHFVERGQVWPDHSFKTAKTLDEARDLIPPGLFNLHRLAGDEPQIVETWV